MVVSSDLEFLPHTSAADGLSSADLACVTSDDTKKQHDVEMNASAIPWVWMPSLGADTGPPDDRALGAAPGDILLLQTR
ncbi:hypothetical protein A1D17_02795 [Pseudomonas fluorescens]|uniref:Uncharacterized protein n=1 Tax=Pseudomonas fluorescens TaxID=294 RepID=A0A162B1Z1_PSEFL|nr:hypothetical protein A1D17_02795 [Pseudomonas fluorescens]